MNFTCHVHNDHTTNVTKDDDNDDDVDDDGGGGGELDLSFVVAIITFCVSRRRSKMYCRHARLCVCVSVRGRMPTLLHGPGCNLGNW